MMYFEKYISIYNKYKYIMSLLKVGILLIVVYVFATKVMGMNIGSSMEGWASSPGTLLQLSAGSSYYPFWQSSYYNRYPYYKYIYPYYRSQPTYLGYMGGAGWPYPYGFNKYY